MRLAEPSVPPYVDPLETIDWSAVDRECWWLPPDALSLAGVADFEALPLPTRRRLSQYEFAHLTEAGLRLEALFVQRLARLASNTRDAARRARYLGEIREEAGHGLMFLELLRRGGVATGGGSRTASRVHDILARSLPTRSALFWAIVVAGEELPNRLNHRLQHGVEDVTLSAVVYRISCLHSRDEGRHAALAREHCEEATRRLAAWQRAALSPLLSRLVNALAHYLYFPPPAVYADAGLAPARLWHRRALANSHRRAAAGAMLEPTLAFLRRAGWRMSSRYPSTA